LRLALALGKTLQELRLTTFSHEYAYWLAYEQLYGLPTSRIEAAIAISGSTVAQSMGAKVKAKDLLPQFERDKPLPYKQGAELFEIWAKEHNKRARKA
jgi:hypothetical protein